MSNMNMDDLIATLPDKGIWSIEKTLSKNPGEKYKASWSDFTVHGAVSNVVWYGETPKQALQRLVCQFTGILADTSGQT